MKKTVIPILMVILAISVFLFAGCDNNTKAEATTTETVTEKTPGKYAASEYLGSWYNADTTEKTLICKLNDDGSAVFKDDKNATWEETQTGITITAKVNGEKVTMEGYFVITGDGYVARATDANMHYLDEGGILQLEIMLTENTCVDCVKK